MIRYIKEVIPETLSSQATSVRLRPFVSLKMLELMRQRLALDQGKFVLPKLKQVLVLAAGNWLLYVGVLRLRVNRLLRMAVFGPTEILPNQFVLVQVLS